MAVCGIHGGPLPGCLECRGEPRNLQCLECGALVEDAALHSAWHLQIMRWIATAQCTAEAASHGTSAW